jgi:hypothetical protein
MRGQNSGFLIQTRIEQGIILVQKGKTIPPIDQEQVLLKIVPAITSDLQIRDRRPLRLRDHIPPRHPDLQAACQADQEEVPQEVLQEVQFQDHPELDNYVNSNLIL